MSNVVAFPDMIAQGLGSPDDWLNSAIDYLKAANGEGDMAGSVEVPRAALHLVLGYVGKLEQRLGIFPGPGGAA